MQSKALESGSLNLSTSSQPGTLNSDLVSQPGIQSPNLSPGSVSAYVTELLITRGGERFSISGLNTFFTDLLSRGRRIHHGSEHFENREDKPISQLLLKDDSKNDDEGGDSS